EPLTTWGTFGRADGQLQHPSAVTVAGDTVYVADWGNHRIQKFTTDRRFLGKWGALRYNELGGTFTPTAIAATRSGEIVVYAGSVYHFRESLNKAPAFRAGCAVMRPATSRESGRC